jgi:hypothetical protein
MEDVLEVYHRPRDPKRPLVCLDEFCKQLLSEKRLPQPARPGSAERYDYEYKREGCATAFMIHAPLEGHREIFITQTARRTQIDYAHALEFIVTDLFPDAEKIILVEDNLNTHKDASLYLAFEPEKARSLAQRFERHYSPKHGSWLNIAESEIAAILKTSVPDRVASVDELRTHCSLGVERRNRAGLKTKWQFTAADARTKLASLYPSIQT